jgi:ribosomal-protein-alanine N-acetyltransferase
MLSQDLAAVLAIEAEANPSPWKASDFSAFLQPSFPGETGGERKAWVFADPEVRGFLCAVGVAGEAELQSVAVWKTRWGRGVGSALMESLCGWARENGYRALHLEVREGNSRALEFYGRWGFASVGRRPQYYRDNGETAVLMSLNLPPKS